MSSNQKKSPLAIKSNLKAGYNQHMSERTPAGAIPADTKKFSTHFQLPK